MHTPNENTDHTISFKAKKEGKDIARSILLEVYSALKEKGYHPPSQLAGWIMDPDPETLIRLRSFVVKDEKNQTVLLFENEFSLRYAKDKNPSIPLYSLEECPTT